MGGQQLFLFERERPSQREKHFMRREKVLGQFFTPPDLARWIVSWVDILGLSKESALDPACGDGIFLKALSEAGFKEIWGIDIDVSSLKGISRKHHPNTRLICADALRLVDRLEERFEFVVGNPPFSAKYGRLRERSILERFEVSRGRKSQAVEVLFLELFIRVVKKRGYIAIILPEGFFASIPMKPIRMWLIERICPLAVIGLSQRFFRARTGILIAGKGLETSKTFLAYAEELDDLEPILKTFTGDAEFESSLWIDKEALTENMSPWHLLLHRAISLDISPAIPLVPLGELLLEIRTGATEYGSWRRFVEVGIPYISAKTITPFGIDISRDGRFVEPGSRMDKPKARVRIGDVLFVRVGVGCAGRVAVVLNEEEEGVADDYIYILRFKKAILPEFFALFAQTRFFKLQIERLKRGVGTVTIPQTALKDVLVPVPSIDVQSYFARIYRDIHEGSIRGEDSSSKLLQALSQLENFLIGGG